MGHVRKDHIKDYWSTDPYLETPIFSKVMSRNRFQQILQLLHLIIITNIIYYDDVV